MRNGIDAVSAPLPTLFVSPPAVFTASLERLPHALGRPRRPAPAGVARHSRQRPVADWRHHVPLTSQRRRPYRRKRFIPRDPPVALVPIGTNRAAPARSFEPAWSPSHERKQIHLSLPSRRRRLALTPAAQADRGNDVVARLNQLYNDTRQDCGGPSKPAFLCSGVLFRATWPSTDYMFYSISPKSQKSGGVSASYLRKDAKYRKLAYGLKSGFIFDTIFGNPKDHQDYAVLCSFPIDAATDDRAQQGCTDSRRTPNSVEKSCQDINVSTAEQWAANYRQNRGDHSRQCSFDVRDERNTAAGPAFYQSIRAMAQIADESFTTQNELRLAKWEENPPKSPSILAAFYTEDAGLEGARLNQIQWYQSVQAFLPIINMRLPQTRQQDAQFAYDGRKQAIYPTSEKNACERYVESATWVERDDPASGRRS